MSSLKNFNEKDVLRAVASITQVHEALILSKMCHRPYGDARAIIATILYDELKYTQKDIAKFLNWKERSTFVAARNKVSNIKELTEIKEEALRQLFYGMIR